MLIKNNIPRRGHITTFTEKEISDIIKKYKNGSPISVVANNYGCSSKTIEKQLRKHNLKIRNASKDKQEFVSEEIEQSIIEEYKSGNSHRVIAKNRGLKPSTVKRILTNSDDYNPRDRSETSRHYYWDFDFFNKNEDNVAYWAGFVYADGNVSKSGKDSGRLKIELHPKDTPQIERFIEDIQLDPKENAIKYGQIKPLAKEPFPYIKITHPKLLKSCKRWGIVPNKTYNWREPKIPDDMVPHFIRGWVDGDGSISKQTRSATVVSYHKEPLEWLASHIPNTQPSYRYSENKQGTAWVITFSNVDFYKFLEFIQYDSELRLERKYAHIDKKWKANDTWRLFPRDFSDQIQAH